MPLFPKNSHCIDHKHSEEKYFPSLLTSFEASRISTPAPLCCVISETAGLHISGLSEDIISYEIWDATSETIIASFSAESDFIDFLFCQTGVVMIRLETESYYLVGYIEI